MVQCSGTSRIDRAQTRRQHLLDTARALFVDTGFHQTGIAQIAAASGIKVGQIYRDFDGKEAIIAAITQADVTAWLEEDVLAAAVAAGDCDAIRAWITRFGCCGETQNECRMIAEVVAEAGRNERIAAIHRAVDVRIKASLNAALAALSPGSCPERVAALGEFILAAGAGVMSRRAVHPDLPADALRALVGAIIDREIGGLDAPR